MSFASMPLFTGDYLRDTRHLAPAEHGCYLLLLMYSWDIQGPIPLDERRICSIINARSTDEVETLRRILAEYFVRLEDGYYNERMMREIERFNAISRKRKGAAEKRWKAKEIQERIEDVHREDALAMHLQSKSNSPTPTLLEPKTLAQPPVDNLDSVDNPTGAPSALGGVNAPRAKARADFIAANAQRLNLDPRPGESHQAFAQRVQRAATE